MNKIIILGKNGMLGGCLYRYFQNVPEIKVIGLSRNDFDAGIHSIDYLESLIGIELSSTSLVFNAIGTIPQSGNKYMLTDKIYHQINTVFPHQLASLVDKYGCRMIHPSTDCVYNGKKGKYVETDAHDETSLYGQSKSQGEPSNCCVIRTSIIGQESSNNRSLLEWVRSKKGLPITGYANHIWNGITCLQYAKIVHQMMRDNIYWTGVRHIFSPQSVSKYDLISMINNIYGLEATIESIKTPGDVDKSLSTIYNENSLFKIPPLETQIQETYYFHHD